LERLHELENAASLIQKNFRRKNPQINKKSKGVSINEKSLLWDIYEESDTSQSSFDDATVEDKEQGRFFALIFVALGSLAMIFYSSFACCFEKVFGRSSDDDDIYQADPTEFTEVSTTQHSSAAANGAQPVPAGNGGGPAPSGAESMAASAAAGSVATGVSTGIAAGVAAGASSAGLVAAVAASSTATQVVAAMAVAAAVAATYTGVELINQATEVPSVISTCGVINPDVHRGGFALSFDGLQREIANREIYLFENLVVTAYNNLTRGNEYNETTGTYNCVDEYLREMQHSSLIRQIFQENTTEGVSNLQIDLGAEIMCQSCPVVLPIFGTKEAEDRRRYLRLLDEVEVFDISFIELYLKTIVEALFDLMNAGELPRTFAPSIVYFKTFDIGLDDVSSLNDTMDDQEGDEQIEVIIPVAVYHDKIKSEISPIFPTNSVNGEVAVGFFEGNFQMSFSGFDLSRSFTDTEILLIEDLFVESYNTQTGNTDGTVREMARAIVARQDFTEGGDNLSTLSITFKAFVTCQSCPEDEPLFGEVDGDEALDLELIRGVLKEVVLGVIDLINNDELPPSFVPTEVYVDDGLNTTDLVNLPILTDVDDNGNIVVDIPDVGLTPEIIEGKFHISFRGFAREFNEEESELMEDLLVTSYNEFTLGGNTSSIYLREMFGANMTKQDFEEAKGDSPSVLDITLNVSVICQDCPESQPVFGVTNGEEGEGLLDWKFIEAVMVNVVAAMLEEINNGDLLSSFLPDEIFLNTNTTDNYLISIPITSFFDETTGKFVVELEPTILELPSSSPSISISPTNMPSVSPSLSASPSSTPSNKPSNSVEPSFRPSSSPSLSASPSETPSYKPSISIEPSQSPTVRASRTPTPVPSNSPTAVPSSEPSLNPTVAPTFEPSNAPSLMDSSIPTLRDSHVPSMEPSESPSASPSTSPSQSPSAQPSITASAQPSDSPSVAPSSAPSGQPSSSPSEAPTSTPSMQPSGSPSEAPSRTPTTSAPTDSPTSAPTNTPTSQPTNSPTSQPTSAPTNTPTSQPTSAPVTSQPTSAATNSPTCFHISNPNSKLC
jgi:hypothetical protein